MCDLELFSKIRSHIQNTVTYVCIIMFAALNVYEKLIGKVDLLEEKSTKYCDI